MKGFIDLSEVESVKAMGGGGKHIQGAPKKGDEGGFFEVGLLHTALEMVKEIFTAIEL
jgi:hypothetical protein